MKRSFVKRTNIAEIRLSNFINRIPNRHSADAMVFKTYLHLVQCSFLNDDGLNHVERMLDLAEKPI